MHGPFSNPITSIRVAMGVIAGGITNPFSYVGKVMVPLVSMMLYPSVDKLMVRLLSQEQNSLEANAIIKSNNIYALSLLIGTALVAETQDNATMMSTTRDISLVVIGTIAGAVVENTLSTMLEGFLPNTTVDHPNIGEGSVHYEPAL